MVLNNQYRCLRPEMLRNLLIDNVKSVNRNKANKMPKEYKEKWIGRLMRERKQIIDGFKNNIHRK